MKMRSSLIHAAFVALLCQLDVVNSALVTRSTVGLSTGVAMQWLRCGTRSSASTPPLLLVHGTFHGAWAWEAHWMEHFAAAGLESHAISLRGTSGTPCDAKSVKITEHVEDLKAFVNEALGGVPPILVGHSFGTRLRSNRHRHGMRSISWLRMRATRACWQAAPPASSTWKRAGRLLAQCCCAACRLRATGRWCCASCGAHFGKRG